VGAANARCALCRSSAESDVLSLPFARSGAGVLGAPRTSPMNVILIAIGCILMALGLMMLANRAGYVYFVVGPGSVLVVAAVVAMLAFWILRAVPG
jgi:hypothetical protein